MLVRMLEDHPALTVAGQVDRASRAIDWLETGSTDIILLDIEMPDRDGLTALPDIIAAANGARIVMVSSSTAAGATVTLRALALGATDAIAKPSAGALGQEFASELIAKLVRLGRSDRETQASAHPVLSCRKAAAGPVAAVAIGASTGGLHALSAFFAALPLSFDAPILVTQHLPSPFMPFFADQLAAISGRACSVARDGEALRRGIVLVAPGDAHLSCERQGSTVVARLLSGAVVNRNLPSVDPMFAGMAGTYGSKGVAVVLSGMGRDGAEGAALVAALGADVLVQDPGSAVVWGMPGTVARRELASMIASPARLAAYLAARGSQ